MKFRVLDPVEDELVEAAWWYEQRQEGLGELFLDAYEQAVPRVIAAPTTFPRLETNDSINLRFTRLVQSSQTCTSR